MHAFIRRAASLRRIIGTAQPSVIEIRLSPAALRTEELKVVDMSFVDRKATISREEFP
jgi:hypothetical protein